MKKITSLIIFAAVLSFVTSSAHAQLFPYTGTSTAPSSSVLDAGSSTTTTAAMSSPSSSISVYSSATSAASSIPTIQTSNNFEINALGTIEGVLISMQNLLVQSNGTISSNELMSVESILNSVESVTTQIVSNLSPSTVQR